MKKLVATLNKIEEVVLVAMFVGMVAIIFIQICFRVANASLYWSEELGKFLFLWISWLGISIGEKRAEHIKITLLTDKMSNKTAHIFNIISELIVIVICAITVRYGIKLMDTQWGTHYTGIKISVGWGYFSVVLGCFLMILRSIATAMISVRGLRSGEPLAHPDAGNEEGGNA